MKARKDESGKIALYSELPADWKNYLNFRAAPVSLQQQEGFFEVVTPEYDPETEVLSELYFSAAAGVFTYDVVQRVFDLEELRAQRLSEFSAVLDQFAVLITKAKLISGDDDPALNAAIAQTRQMRVDTLAAIRAIDNVEAMRAFRIRNEDVDYFKSLFEPFV